MLKYVFIVLFLVGCGASNQSKSDINTIHNLDSSVHIFGDSIFTTLNHRIKSLLEISMEQSIDDHARQGAWTWEITKQYEIARGKKSLVIFDGGGNDVLGNRGNCKAFNDACRQVVANGIKNHEDALRMMEQDGVERVIFLGFHYPTGWNGGLENVIDYTYPLLKNMCDESSIPCAIVDTREKFRTTKGLLEWDGIHPNRQGTQVMADMIFSVYSNF